MPEQGVVRAVPRDVIAIQLEQWERSGTAPVAGADRILTVLAEMGYSVTHRSESDPETEVVVDGPTLTCRDWRVWPGHCGVHYQGHPASKAVNRGLSEDPLGLAALALALHRLGAR